MTWTTCQEIEARKLAAMTPADRAVFEETYNATRLALDVGDKIRDAREAAGLT